MPSLQSVETAAAPVAPTAPPRRPKSQLDAHMRTKIVELKTVAGWTYQQIHRQYPEVPLSTIKSTVSRAKDRYQNETLPRSGRPKKLNVDDKKLLLDTVDSNPRATYDELIAMLGGKVSKTCVWRFLRSEGRSLGTASAGNAKKSQQSPRSTPKDS